MGLSKPVFGAVMHKFAIFAILSIKNQGKKIGGMDKKSDSAFFMHCFYRILV